MNTKWIKLLTATLLLCVSFATSAWGQNQSSVNSDVAGPNRLFGAAQWYNAHDSHTSDETIDLEIWGGMVGYQFADREDWYFLMRGMYSGGKGNKTVAGVEYQPFSHPWFFEGRMGYQFGFGEGQEFGATPYIGYMYASNNTGLKNTAAIKGLHSELRQHNVNVGILLDWMVMPEFQVGLDIEALFNVRGKLKLSSDTPDAASDTKLKNQVNWWFELPLTWQFDTTWDLSFVPFYHKNEFKVKDSDSDDKFKSSDAGLRVEVGYRF